MRVSPVASWSYVSWRLPPKHLRSLRLFLLPGWRQLALEIHAFGAKGRQVSEPRLVHCVFPVLPMHTLCRPVAAIPTFVDASLERERGFGRVALGFAR